MKRKNLNRNALVTSIISLLLCVSMLVGTTFAWFTDEVVTGMNTIAAGNLDVALLAGGTEVGGETKLFDKEEAWEPGVVVYENLQVVNKGTLALKYDMTLSFGNENSVEDAEGNEHTLSEVLQVAVIDKIENATRQQVLAAAKTSATSVSGFKMTGELEAGKSSTEQAVVIFWEPNENARDNIYNINNGKTTSNGKPLHIDFGVTLKATQLMSEQDSFGKDYDEEAEYPPSVVVADNADKPSAVEDGRVTVYIPVGAPGGMYSVNVTNEVLNEGNYSCDISLTHDGKKVEPQTGVKYPVEIQLDPVLDIHTLTHNGEAITDFEYDLYNGLLTFETDSFSPFAVEYTKMGENVTFSESKNLTGGVFETGYDPAEYIDPSLKEADSAYIAVPYTKGGEACWVVSERATTVVLTPENASGKLWSIISGLQNNAHSTVYLMPGTYNEATTVYVYSSMDIIGLGDKDSVKVVKQPSSGSNRHLFNCNGTKADYIEVTLRNLYLDATAKTTNSKDNAAVQSIRKSMVKCYDLTIVKGSGWDAVAFYVNGNNAVDGVKYPAYLYAENCALNTTREFGVVTTSGSYKFFHNGLTYSGKAYTKNSGSIQNKTMEANDWTWD